jgi:hypothetical protein
VGACGTFPHHAQKAPERLELRFATNDAVHDAALPSSGLDYAAVRSPLLAMGVLFKNHQIEGSGRVLGGLATSRSCWGRLRAWSGRRVWDSRRATRFSGFEFCRRRRKSSSTQ